MAPLAFGPVRRVPAVDRGNRGGQPDPMLGEMLGGEGDGDRPPAAASAVPVGFKCPEGTICRSKPSGSKSWIGCSTTSVRGDLRPARHADREPQRAALVFLRLSGPWMYTRMWSHCCTKITNPVVLEMTAPPPRPTTCSIP